MPPLPPLYTLQQIESVREAPSDDNCGVVVRQVSARYADASGALHTRTFEASAGIDPVVPKVATIQELCDLRFQW